MHTRRPWVFAKRVFAKRVFAKRVFAKRVSPAEFYLIRFRIGELLLNRKMK
jgi:hypothetical protein